MARGNTNQKSEGRAYRALVRACKERDIPRSRAFAMAKDGTLETFILFRQRYVYVDSLDTLPQRIGTHQAKP